MLHYASVQNWTFSPIFPPLLCVKSVFLYRFLDVSETGLVYWMQLPPPPTGGNDHGRQLPDGVSRCEGAPFHPEEGDPHPTGEFCYLCVRWHDQSHDLPQRVTDRAFSVSLSPQRYGDDDWGWESIDQTVRLSVVPTEQVKNMMNDFFHTYDFCITGEVSTS